MKSGFGGVASGFVGVPSGFGRVVTGLSVSEKMWRQFSVHLSTRSGVLLDHQFVMNAFTIRNTI